MADWPTSRYPSTFLFNPQILFADVAYILSSIVRSEVTCHHHAPFQCQTFPSLLMAKTSFSEPEAKQKS